MTKDLEEGKTTDDVTGVPVAATGESMRLPLLTTDGNEYEIPEEGSLGLLAMGYTGIMLWREKRYAKAREDA